MGTTDSSAPGTAPGGRQMLESVMRATRPIEVSFRGRSIWDRDSMTRAAAHDRPSDRFPISPLAASTGVPSVTIHHYRRLGLLPEPARSSANRFLHDVRHVRALRLIRALRERRRLRL